MKQLLILLLSISCLKLANAQLVNLQACKNLSPFIVKFGFNPKRTFISTSEKHKEGLCIIEYPDSLNAGNKPKIYQHASWKTYGAMGTICITEKGDIFLVPIPTVNVLHNPKAKQSTIYKVDALSGEMKPYLKLTTPTKYNEANAFGLLGITYDCTTRILYVSTVAASDINQEKGMMYAIDTKARQPLIIDSLQGKDIIGLGITGVALNDKLLLAGSARTSDIYTIKIDNTGKFTERNFTPAFTLQNIGPRGDDKAKKIELNKAGELTVKSVEFDWNLTAPTEQQHAIYTYRYDKLTRRFIRIDFFNTEPIQQF